MHTVITTVGTSLFHNYSKLDGRKEVDKVRNFIEDTKEISYSDWKKYKDDIERVRRCVLEWSVDNENASAEIKSLHHLQKEKDNLYVHLIATDTIQSYLAAEIILESLKHENISLNQEIYCIKALQVKNADEFKNVGIPNFLRVIKKDIKKDKSSEYILNISGGYKALIPYLTLMGQLFEMELCYIYEDSDKLIKMPVLPFNLDWVFAQKVYEPMHTENLEGLNRNSEAFKELSKYSLVREEENKCNLTGLGMMIRDYIQTEYEFSRQALGHFMEYKIFEYYVQNKYGEYKYVERSNDSCKNEFDVILSNAPIGKGLEGNIVVIESKLYKRLEDRDKEDGHYKLEKQIFQKINLLRGKNKKLDEFHLCIFLTSKNQEDIITKEKKFDDRFAGIAQEIKKSFVNCPFKVFLAKTISNNISRNDRVNYQNIATMKLDEKTFKFYKKF